MQNILNFFRKNKISNSPYEYNFLMNLKESEYPKYLKKIFKCRTGEELPLKKILNCRAGKAFLNLFNRTENVEKANPRGQELCNYIIDKNKCKTFNQKIQWIKLYDVTPLMRDCTDKVEVRGFVREKIGDEYLKPALQIVRNEKLEVKSDNSISNSLLLTPNLFDKVDFEKLPDSFVIKCNHGCKWHFIIKNKNQFLNNERLFNQIKQQIIGWLEQEFWSFEGFELNYKGIEPKILIEPFMLEERCKVPRAIEIFCFNGIPKIFVDIQVNEEHKICIYNEDFSYSDLILHPNGKMLITQIPADELIKQAVELSKALSKEFKFVRVDWMVYQNKLYFEELTFTPYSGFTRFDKKWNLKLGNLIEI